MNRRWTTKRWAIITAIAAAILAAILLILWGSSSSQGTIVTKYAVDRVRYSTLNGQKFRLEYNQHYSVRTLKPQDANDIEDYNLIADTIYDKRLAIAVTKLPSGQLTDLSAYVLRTVHQDMYAEQTKPVAAGKALIFTRTTEPDTTDAASAQSKEQTVFLQHGNLALTLSFTTTGATDNLTDEVNHVTGSVAWK